MDKKLEMYLRLYVISKQTRREVNVRNTTTVSSIKYKHIDVNQVKVTMYHRVIYLYGVK